MVLISRYATLLAVMLFGQASSSANESDAVAIPDQIAEGINLSGGVRAAVTEFWHSHGRFPLDNTEAGLLQPYEIVGRFVVAVTVTGDEGVVSVEFGADADWGISGRTIEMTPKVTSDKSIRWSCSSQFIENRLLPSNCNGQKLPTGT